MGGKSKKVTVGYRYKMGLHFVITRWADSIKEIIAGERSAWAGEVTENETIYIDAPKLFGGDKREGGILGDCDIEFGLPTQGANSYLQGILGSPMPGHRGFVGAVFNGGRVTSNNPYIKPWWFRVQRIHVNGDGTQTQWYDEKAEIALGAGGFDPIEVNYNGGPNFPTTLNVDIGSALGTIEIEYATGPNPDKIEVWFDGVKVVDTGYHGDSSFQTALNSYLTSHSLPTETIVPYPGGYANATQQWNSVTDREQVSFEKTSSSSTMQIRVYGPLSGTLWYIGVARAGSGGLLGMNPAHIVRECLTDPYFRLAYPDTMIDDTSFMAAADTFYDEGFGLCYFWNQQTDVKQFIQLILDHCGATYYADPYTGKFVLKAIRDDYVVGDLDVYDESSIVDVTEFQRSGQGEVVNEITVIYTDVTTGNEKSVTVQNNAAIQEQGYVVSKTINYPALPTADLAARVAQRDLVAISSSLAQMKVKFTRLAWPLRPGDVIKLSWAKLGISELVCRVMAIDYGLLEDGHILADLAEDVFGLPTTSFQAEQPSGWEAPLEDPLPIAVQDLVEAPYYEVVRQLSEADLNTVDEDAGFVLTLAATPQQGHLGYNIYSRIDPAAFEERASASFTATAVLYDAVERSDTTITFGEANGFGSESVEVGDLIMVGTGRTAELMEVTDITDIDSGMIGVNRGILDTTPGEYAIGDRVWLFEDGYGEEDIERATGDTVDVTLTSFTGQGESTFAIATNMDILLDQRFFRPYPPGNVAIDGEPFPDTDVQPEFTITWAHRDRVQQTASYVAQEEGSIGPEMYTLYNIYFYDDDTDDEMFSVLDVDGDTYTMPNVSGSFTGRLEIESTREGVVSWQRQVRVFPYVGSLPMLGAMLTDSGATTMTISATTVIDWDTLVDDDGGFFGSPSTLLTVPEPGWYVASFNHIADAGASAWWLETEIALTGNVSGVTRIGRKANVIRTTEDHPRRVMTLDRFSAGGTLTARGTRDGSGSGSPTIEAGSKFNVARIYSSPVVGAVVRRLASQSIASGTDVAMSFDDETLDDGNMWDSGAPTRLTVPTGGAGWYVVIGHIGYATSTSSDSRVAFLRVNGAAGVGFPGRKSWTGSNGSLSVENGAMVGAIIYLADGDYVELIARQTVGTVNATATLTACRAGRGFLRGAAVRYTGSAQTVNSGADVVITFDDEIRDDGDMVDLGVSNSRIYAIEDGYYAVSGWLTFSSNSNTWRYAAIRVDGVTEVSRDGNYANTDLSAPSCNPFAVVYLHEGQYVELIARTGTNVSTLTGDNRPRFGMCLLCKEETS